MEEIPDEQVKLSLQTEEKENYYIDEMSGKSIFISFLALILIIIIASAPGFTMISSLSSIKKKKHIPNYSEFYPYVITLKFPNLIPKSELLSIRMKLINLTTLNHTRLSGNVYVNSQKGSKFIDNNISYPFPTTEFHIKDGLSQFVEIFRDEVNYDFLTLDLNIQTGSGNTDTILFQFMTSNISYSVITFSIRTYLFLIAIISLYIQHFHPIIKAKKNSFIRISLDILHILLLIDLNPLYYLSFIKEFHIDQFLRSIFIGAKFLILSYLIIGQNPSFSKSDLFLPIICSVYFFISHFLNFLYPKLSVRESFFLSFMEPKSSFNKSKSLLTALISYLVYLFVLFISSVEISFGQSALHKWRLYIHYLLIVFLAIPPEILKYCNIQSSKGQSTVLIWDFLFDSLLVLSLNFLYSPSSLNKYTNLQDTDISNN